MLPLSNLLSSQDVRSDSSLVPTKACTVSESIGRQKREKREPMSNKEFNLEAVGFRTYEAPLFHELQESGHTQFVALIGLTEFMRLSWTEVHTELAMEFLKNYRKNKSSRMSLSSIVRSNRITLTKKLIASTFHLSPSGYKHKNKQVAKEAVSSLFDPVTARRNGYYIRDCKDPTYFERLEALNRLICFKPPGHLISAVLVDVVIHAAIEPVDWAGLLLFSLMKELDRVTSSLRQPPCTLVGVHIFLILSNLEIVTTEDRLAAESFPFILLDGYSTANSVASDSFPSSAKSSQLGSPRSLKPGSRLAEMLGLNKEDHKPPNVSSHESSPSSAKSSLRSLTPGSRLAEILGLNKEFQKPLNVSSPDSSQLGSFLADVIDTDKRGQKSSTVPSGSIRIARRDIPSMTTNMGGQKSSPGHSSIARREITFLATDIGDQKSPTKPSVSFQSATKYHFSLGAVVRLYLKRALQCFQPSVAE